MHTKNMHSNKLNNKKGVIFQTLKTKCLIINDQLLRINTKSSISIIFGSVQLDRYKIQGK